MFERLKEMIFRRREVMLYLLFGGLTTAVDWIISFLLYFFWGDFIEKQSYLIHLANAIAWFAAVVFAYLTNRKWVFESKKTGCREKAKEFFSFLSGRILTLLLQEMLFAIFFQWLGFNEYFVKIFAAVLVVVLNYLLSKFFVFRKKR